MRGGMRSSPWSALPEKMIWMRPIDAGPNPAADPPRPPNQRKQSNGQAPATQRTDDGKLPGPSARSVLGAQLSASLRESLIEQLAAISSADEATAWAHRSLPAKK